MKTDEASMREIMRRRGITDALVAEFGGQFVDGVFLCEDAAFQSMLRKAAGVRGQPFGLGDAVASVAQPIAGILDSVLGTHIKGCSGCAQRRDALNRIVPNIKP